MKNFFQKTLFAVSAAAMFAGTVSAATLPVSDAPIIAIEKTTGDPVMPNAVVKDAFKAFKSLSKAERKLRIKEAKKAVKEYKNEKKAGAEPNTNTLLLVILAILLPPLAVYLHQGEINNKFWISLLLTLLFFLPGVIYALVVILDKK